MFRHYAITWKYHVHLSFWALLGIRLPCKTSVLMWDKDQIHDFTIWSIAIVTCTLLIWSGILNKLQKEKAVNSHIQEQSTVLDSEKDKTSSSRSCYLFCEWIFFFWISSLKLGSLYHRFHTELKRLHATRHIFFES